MFGRNGTVHESGGVSVHNGKGLLFHIGLKGFTPFDDYSDNNSPSRNFVFHSKTSTIDISVIGGGGCALKDSVYGGAGGGGSRAIVETVGDVFIRIGGGMNTHWSSGTFGRSEGSSETHPGTTVVTDATQTFKLIGFSGGTEKGGGSSINNIGGFVHKSTGCNSIDGDGCQTTIGTQRTAISSYDLTFEPDFGGRGQGLSGYNYLPSTKGSGLGGGGGGQNSYAYGGSSIPSEGGRFGYRGGIANSNTNGAQNANPEYNHGFGPSPGESNSIRGGVYIYKNGGGGGSFGGGGGADGSSGDGFGVGGTGAGGAVLLLFLKNQSFFRFYRKPKFLDMTCFLLMLLSYKRK